MIIYTYIYIYVYIYVYIIIYIYMYIYVYVCVYIYICMYIYMYNIYIYIFIYLYLYIRILPTYVDPNGKDKYETSFAHQAISTNFPRMINDDHPIILYSKYHLCPQLDELDPSTSDFPAAVAPCAPKSFGACSASR